MPKEDFPEIELQKLILAAPKRVFAALIDPRDLQRWHHAGDWTTPSAEVDAREGGKIRIAYADPQGETQFHLIGEIEVYDPPRELNYRLDDGRLVRIMLEDQGDKTLVQMRIDAEPQTKLEYQIQGWGAHLDNLAQYLNNEE